MYFDISFLFKKSHFTKEEVYKFLYKNFNLSEGENENSYFGKRKIIIFYVEDEDDEANYDEICISFSEQIFHEETFEKELQVFTFFVNICFEHFAEIKFAVCSYETNGYLLEGIKKLESFNDKLLSRFPISYKRQEATKDAFLILNLKAQAIFD